jgi:hypothetical protein
MTQAPCARAGGDSSPPPKSLRCPGERAWTNADSAHSSCGGDGAARLQRGAVRPQELSNQTRLKRGGVAHGYCPDTGLVDVPCIVRGDTMPNRKKETTP